MRDNAHQPSGRESREETPGTEQVEAEQDKAPPGESEQREVFRGESLSAGPLQLRPLSIQAAALVKSIEGLSSIFWISLVGVFLSIFFVGLNQLDVNASTDHLFLGEYQVPKSIMPLAAVAFAVFVFWLTSNRLKVLELALKTSSLPEETVREIFRLNPPVLNVFHADNVNPWSPSNGVSVFILAWAVFYGNSAALTWSSALQQGAYLGQFDAQQIGIYLLLIIGGIVYGIRSIVPPLKEILTTLHNVSFRLGWPRHVLAAFVGTLVFIVNHWEQFDSPGEQPDNLLGPAIGNAIDGETLLLRGTEVRLFGIDAVEADQICQNRDGLDYPCGRLATQALQNLMQRHPVICLPLFAINDQRLVANCEIARDGTDAPLSPLEFMEDLRPDNLSRLMVAEGHALPIGIGRRFFGADQNEAQNQRRGVWQGSFQPPNGWRQRPDSR